MNDASKVKPSHIQRAAFVYIRQSTPAQVEYNRESTACQYDLLEKACQLGWAKEQVIVVDEDLGVSGSGFAERSGFARMTAEVALGHVGIVFGLEVSPVARNNADWYLISRGKGNAHRYPTPSAAVTRRGVRMSRSA